ncbi:outer membrane scaffolding protein for murein synthesis (MipA/OmpV family) [Pseudoduganella flava]|uniref:MipA/OmpV family protein n=1 Tax=Pseudoduganella flava TaxID=871742 RepID=A0A562PGJ8_9BURK|nr:MipA/OmpV family protein [Pseudoduganella flava]QGZ40279.1 MipA/OmpV family protein [Pseudoduganella flava]TWI43463.1 outer membrane scaffolding protein for murein synthesis (MipA/OmpV family) [Pseudoduganella flava]
MYKLLVLALAGMCGAAHAQTPSTNPMPDGSRDMYVGLGAQYTARYEGARERRTTALPMLQIEWSNGVFVSGLSAGMHLSSSPRVEYGPMIALNAGRDASGTRMYRLGSVSEASGDPGGPATWLPPPVDTGPVDIGEPKDDGGSPPDAPVNRLDGMTNIEPRLVYGGFANFYLTPKLRLTTTTLYGAGNDRRGLRMYVALQHIAQEIAPHHTLSLAAGVTVVNRAYNMAYFGVTREEADFHRINPEYAPDGGIADVRVGARWNWGLSPAWMITSGVQANRLVGDARKSPLVERPTNLSVTTALAYRF